MTKNFKIKIKQNYEIFLILLIFITVVQQATSILQKIKLKIPITI